MGSIRLWIALIIAQIAVIIALAVAGPVTATTPALRYTGFACLAGIFVCIPPLVIKSFVAAQVRIGNDAQSFVRNIQQHEAGIVVGVWALIGVALVLAFPRINDDLLTDRISGGSASSVVAPLNPSSGEVATAPTTVTQDTTDAERNDTTKLLTPGAGSSVRTAMLDALRQRLKMAGKFKVDHIRTWGRWGFVRATEVVELDKGELQETDLTVAALLELPESSATGWWRIVELWTLPDDQTHSMADFLHGIREKQRAKNLPSALFPDDFR